MKVHVVQALIELLADQKQPKYRIFFNLNCMANTNLAAFEKLVKRTRDKYLSLYCWKIILKKSDTR
jgi:hypothetical protein